MEAETSGRPAAAAAERPVGADGYPVGGYGTAEEVAAFLSMSVSGVRKLVRAGRLPSVRLARRVVRLPWLAVRAVVTAAAAEQAAWADGPVPAWAAATASCTGLWRPVSEWVTAPWTE